MDFLSSIVKYILYIFNLIFVVCGILLIILGGLMLGNMGDFKSFESAVNTETIPILIIILGSLIFIVSFFGCCGAIRENECCTTTYAIFMFVLFCLQIALVVWIFVENDNFLNTMENIVNIAWDENDTAHGYPMDALQLSFKCCGKFNYMDYSAGNVPSSCCGYTDRSTSCSAEIYESRPGCRQEFVSFWRTNTNIIRYAGIGIAVVELVAFTFAFCLASNMRNRRRNM